MGRHLLFEKAYAYGCPQDSCSIFILQPLRQIHDCIACLHYNCVFNLMISINKSTEGLLGI